MAEGKQYKNRAKSRYQSKFKSNTEYLMKWNIKSLKSWVKLINVKVNSLNAKSNEDALIKDYKLIPNDWLCMQNALFDKTM